MHTTDPFDAGDLVEQEMLVAIDIRHHHFQQIVGLLAGDQVALLHFRVTGDLFLKIRKAFRGMAVHADLDDHGQVQAQFACVQHGLPLENNASSFQLLYPPGTGGRGQPHGFRQLLVGQPAVVLQRFQDAQVGAVQFCQCLLAHDDIRPVLHFLRNIIANKADYG